MPGLIPAAATPALCIGLMSGTSLDGVDAVLAEFAGATTSVRGAVHLPFGGELRAALLVLQNPGPDELHRAAAAANVLVDCYAAAVKALLVETGTGAGAISVIGAHGQTVRHNPDAGYTWQINNPARLAEATGIAVVADFRSRDVAAGGQGAPLVPAFHAALFQDADRHRAVVNIGGMANVTNLPAGARGTAVTGWDTGPGNVLLDAWCARHGRGPFDRNGEWAATGTVLGDLWRDLLADPYFARTPPKSTGRDLFNAGWLETRLQGGERAEDVQATLLALTAHSIARDIGRHCAGASQVLVCGGGASNGALLRALAAALAADGAVAGGARPIVQPTDELGVPAHQVEALAFAWLAWRLLSGEPGNLPAVTGARGPRLLGAYYPA